jgi:hypothetical protein
MVLLKWYVMGLLRRLIGTGTALALAQWAIRKLRKHREEIKALILKKLNKGKA